MAVQGVGMTGGDLREWVTVTKRSETTDTQGGRSNTWVDLVTGNATVLTKLPARVQPADPKERLQAQSIGAQHDYLVTMRYRRDITSTMRVNWTPWAPSSQTATAKTLEIHGVQPHRGLRDYVELSCGERI